jgi:hypothetical protein
LVFNGEAVNFCSSQILIVINRDWMNQMKIFRSSYVIAIAGLLFFSMSVRATTLADFGEAYRARDYARAVWVLEQMMEKGDPNAMALMGRMYARGQGVPTDTKKALQLINDAKNRGSIIADPELANIYENGLGVPIDLQKALDHYKSYLASAKSQAATDSAKQSIARVEEKLKTANRPQTNALSNKEVALKEKELELRQRELALKESELKVREKNLAEAAARVQEPARPAPGDSRSEPAKAPVQAKKSDPTPQNQAARDNEKVAAQQPKQADKIPLARAFANHFGPAGWARCAAANATMSALVARGDRIRPEIVEQNKVIGDILGPIRRVMLADGVPQNQLDRLVSGQSSQIRSGDEAARLMIQCYNEAVDISEKWNK